MVRFTVHEQIRNNVAKNTFFFCVVEQKHCCFLLRTLLLHLCFFVTDKALHVIDYSVTAHERNVNCGYQNKLEFRDKIMYFSMVAKNLINARYLTNTQIKAEGCIIHSVTFKRPLSGDKSMIRMGAN